MSVELLLYILAVFLLTIYALGARLPRVDLGWLGLALFVFTLGILGHL